MVYNCDKIIKLIVNKYFEIIIMECLGKLILNGRIVNEEAWELTEIKKWKLTKER